MANLIPALLSLVLAGSIIVVFVGLARVARESEIDERVAKYLGIGRATSVAQGGRAGGSRMVRRIDRAVAGRGLYARTAIDLAQADLKVTVAEYYLFKLVFALAGMALGAFMGRAYGVGLWVFAGMGFLLGWLIPGFYVRYRKGARIKAFNEQLPDGITLMANSLRAGYSLLQSMDMIADEGAPPLSEEFRRVVREVGLGLSFDEALLNLMRRVPSDDLDLMITAIVIQHEVGGNLAQILDTIAHTIRERVRIRGEIKVLTAQQTIAGYIVSFLPAVLAGALMILSPGYMGRLFVWPWIMLPILGLVMMLIGFAVIRKIVAIEV
jgi:tight adherence protein B